MTTIEEILVGESKNVEFKENLPDKFWKYYQKYQAGEINVSEFARLLKCSKDVLRAANE